MKKCGLKDTGFELFSWIKFKKRQIITVYVGKIIEPGVNSIYLATNGDIVTDCRAWRKGVAYLGAHMYTAPSWNGQKSSVRYNAKI